VCERHNAGTTVPFAHFFRSAPCYLNTVKKGIGSFSAFLLGFSVYDKSGKILCDI
jgi:hypothetical protein